VLDVWEWITELRNSKIVALLIFFATFLGIIIYVFSRKRARRLESYRYIPFQDGDGDGQDDEAVSDDERRKRQA